MPDNKRQHFVPRAHFRPFSLNAEGRAIQVHNLRTGASIPNASVGGQCAKDYFYGRDLAIEKLLRGIEGVYATVLRRLTSDSFLVESDLDFIRSFTLLQHLRTEAAFQRYRAMTDGIKGAVFKEWHAKQPAESDKEVALHALHAFVSSRKYIADLKTCILANQTAHDFITSDDPAFITKYHFVRLGRQSFGWGSSGAVMILPLTPRYALMCCDQQVYTVPGKRGSVLVV